jgi:alpha-glucosidase
MLRPLVYEFMDDPKLRSLSSQVMLGPWLMAAPVVTKDATSRKVYLPAGRWYEAYSGMAFDGPMELDVPVVLGALPLFAREGAILPRLPVSQWTDAAPATELSFDLYPSSKETTFRLYDDAGDGFAYQQGEHAKIDLALTQTKTGTRFTATARSGSLAAPVRKLRIRVHGVTAAATEVRLTGEPVAQRQTLAELESASNGWWWDENDQSLSVVFPDPGDFSLELDHPHEGTLSPTIRQRFRVKVPPNTPKTTKIHVASSAFGWTHKPLEWSTESGYAEGELELPRGAWHEYKYTRGDWPQVEKDGACQERPNRTTIATALPQVQDVVSAWADSCP